MEWARRTHSFYLRKESGQRTSRSETFLISRCRTSFHANFDRTESSVEAAASGFRSHPERQTPGRRTRVIRVSRRSGGQNNRGRQRDILRGCYNCNCLERGPRDDGLAATLDVRPTIIRAAAVRHRLARCGATRIRGSAGVGSFAQASIQGFATSCSSQHDRCKQYSE